MSRTLQYVLSGAIGEHFDRLPGGVLGRASKSRREDKVSIWQSLGASQGIRVVPHVYVEFEGRSHCFLVDCPRLPSAVTGLDAETADVAIVEEKQRLLIEIVHIVLIGKPRAGIRGVDGKIPIFPQSPNDVPVAGPAVVVDLDLPSLVTDGHQEVAVLSGPR